MKPSGALKTNSAEPESGPDILQLCHTGSHGISLDPPFLVLETVICTGPLGGLGHVGETPSTQPGRCRVHLRLLRRVRVITIYEADVLEVGQQQRQQDVQALGYRMHHVIEPLRVSLGVTFSIFILIL